MSTVEKFLTGVNLSVRQFCEEMNRDRDTVARQVRAANTKPSGKRGGHPVYRMRDLMAAAYLSDEEGRVDPDRMRPFERGAYYKAELDKLKLQTELGELVPRLEMEQEFARAMKILARNLDTIPDRVERDTGAAPLVISSVERSLDGVREEVYAALIGDRPEDDVQSTDLQSA